MTIEQWVNNARKIGYTSSQIADILRGSTTLIAYVGWSPEIVEKVYNNLKKEKKYKR